MTTSVRGTSDVYGIIGWPVARSLSPAMQTRVLAQLGLDAVYVPFAVRSGDVAGALTGLFACGVRGLNVTTPHKTEAAALAVRATDAVLRSRSANTLVRAEDGWHAHTTDGDGMVAALRDECGIDPRDARVRILGGGGAGRSIAEALVRAGADRVEIGARDAARVLVAPDLLRAVQVVDVDAASECDVVISTIPPAALTTDVAERMIAACGAGVRCVVDAAYGVESAVLHVARARGCATYDGLGLLAYQGALSLSLWLDRAIEQAMMRSALEAALRDSP